MYFVLYYIFSVKNLISFVTFDEGTVLDFRFEFFSAAIDFFCFLKF